MADQAMYRQGNQSVFVGGRLWTLLPPPANKNTSRSFTSVQMFHTHTQLHTYTYVTYVYRNIHRHNHTHTHTNTYIYIYIHIYIYTCIYTHTYTLTDFIVCFIYIYVCVCLQISINHLPIRMHMYVCNICLSSCTFIYGKKGRTQDWNSSLSTVCAKKLRLYGFWELIILYTGYHDA